jgi:hypothetical protein
MEKNKTGKYFKYAIGEIILVVIGILIALQINNWNENRKIKTKETIILKELLTSINSDLKAYESFSEPRLERKKRGLDSLFSYLFDKKEIQDSSFIDFYTNMSHDIFVRFDNGPFEDLKSSGLDIINNDSLRTAINNAYTVKLPLYSQLANMLYDESKPEISKLEHKFLNLIPVINKDGRRDLHFNLKEYDILTNQDFLWILDIEQKKYDEYTLQVKQTRTTLNQLKTDIENELITIIRI